MSKTDRHNRIKLRQLQRRLAQAEANGNWPIVPGLNQKIYEVKRRLWVD